MGKQMSVIVFQVWCRIVTKLTSKCLARFVSSFGFQMFYGKQMSVIVFQVWCRIVTYLTSKYLARFLSSFGFHLFPICILETFSPKKIRKIMLTFLSLFFRNSLHYAAKPDFTTLF